MSDILGKGELKDQLNVQLPQSIGKVTIEVRCGWHGGQDQTVMRRGSTKPAVFSTAILNTKLQEYIPRQC